MGSRSALLIATSQYIDPRLRRLRAPVEEAQRLKEILRDPAVGGFDQVSVLANESKAEIERRAEELFHGRQPDDLVLLYLSGHGIRNEHDRLFFAACNTETNYPRATAMSAEFVHGFLEACNAGVKVVLLDCCYSGLFSDGMRPRATTSIDLETSLVGRGTYVLTATNEIEFAWEGERLILEGPQFESIFTRAIIEGLESGDADVDKDGVVTGAELYKYVYEQVRGAGHQTPIQFGKMEGSFLIGKNPKLGSANFGPYETVTLTLGQILPKIADQDAKSGIDPKAERQTL